MSTDNNTSTTPATTDRTGTPPRRSVAAENPLRTSITSAATVRRLLGVQDAYPATGTATTAVDTSHINDDPAVGVRGA